MIMATILLLAAADAVKFESRAQSKPFYSLTADLLITVITVK